MMVLRRFLGIALEAQKPRIPTQRLIHTRPVISTRTSSLTKYRFTSPVIRHSPFHCTTGYLTLHYAPITTVRVPTMAESITEGTSTQFSRQVGDFIEQDDELATIETDKIDVSVNAPHSGVIQKLLVGEGDTVTVDQAIAEIQEAKTPEKKTATEEEKQQPTNKRRSEASTAPPQPQSTQSTTSTPKPQDAVSPAPELPNYEPSTNFPKHRHEERVKMTRIRQKTAQHLKASQQTAAFLTTFNEVDMSAILDFRKKHRDAVFERHGVKLGMMGAMARASALALKDIPAVNASIENGDTVVYRDYVDLSVAASIPKGLVTPVLRNIESMSIVQIEKGIAEMVKKARDGKLTMDDLTGGSFTISNSGIWGSLFGTPIINIPQTAVLGTYGIQDRPVAIDGKIEIRPMMYVALTYDHRIIDGREAVTFLNLVKKYLGRPDTMLLE